MSFWNERRFILSAIKHALPFVDKLILVDGAYESMRNYGFPYPHSGDGTLERIRDCLPDKYWKKIKLYEVSDFWKNEVEKRNFMLSKAREGDYVFIVDGDEITWGLPKLLRETLTRIAPDVIYIPVYSIPDTEYFPVQQNQLMPRIFRKRRGWKYKDKHWWIVDEDGDLVMSHNLPPQNQNLPHHKYSYMAIDFMGITNMRGLKPTWRKKLAKTYYIDMGEKGWMEA